MLVSHTTKTFHPNSANPARAADWMANTRFSGRCHYMHTDNDMTLTALSCVLGYRGMDTRTHSSLPLPG